MGIINSGFLTVSTFLQQHIYNVPEYQRGYSWTEDQLEDMWIDLIQLYKDQDLSSHFLGQVVVHFDSTENKWYVIDGQQRTSTSIILLDSFRQLLDEINEEFDLEDAKIDADDITTKYIGRVTQKRQDQRLILGESDKRFFKDLIQIRGNDYYLDVKPKKLSNSESLIYQASTFYKDKLVSFIQQSDDPEKKYSILSDLLELFLSNFKLMYVETDDINEAFIIFETLNARGKDLETSDLLKNHVFRSSNNKIENIKNQWYQMIENLGNVDPTRFIRHYWNSQYKFVREKDLYKSIRKYIDTPKKVEDLMDDLVQLSDLYTSLNHPKNYVYFQNNSLIERTKEIKNLGASSYFPIILALENENYSEGDIDEILESIESLVVRNFVVAGKTANRFETEFAKIAYHISQHSLNEASEIVKAIKDLTINDEEFIDDFKIFTTKKTSTIRYLLRKIHNHSNTETRIINDNNAIHIEHIMPKKIQYWDMSNDEHSEYLWRLGNLTLLGHEYNRKATNREFDYKKTVYTKSDIPMTKELVKYDIWTTKDIEERQKSFVDAALQIWKK